MNPSEMINAIAAPDFDRPGFTRLALESADLRNLLVEGMLNHPHIMVYYHCFYVLEDAVQQSPALFYPYWQSFAGLLDHSNSYHRDFGLTLIAGLACVDVDNQFEPLFETYFAHLNDPKMMTAECCLRNISKILDAKKELIEPVIQRLLQLNQLCDYTPKQKALLDSDILDILARYASQVQNKTALQNHLQSCVNSLSPKTRSKARQLIQQGVF